MLEIIKNQANGFLVPPGDFITMGKQIVDLVSNPLESHSLKKTWRDILSKYSFSESVEKYLSLYSSLLNPNQMA